MLNLGHEILQKVMEKVMESHGILTGQKCTNPAVIRHFVSRFPRALLFLSQEKSSGVEIEDCACTEERGIFKDLFIS